MVEPTTNDAAETSEANPKQAAVKLLARTLWRARIAIPEGIGASEDTEEETTKPDRSDWKETKSDYLKLAKRLHRRMEQNGATFTVSEKAGEDDESDSDEEQGANEQTSVSA